MNSPRVTLEMIAAETSVSTATVSKVLNNRRGVSELTRVRVARVLQAHGYTKRGVASPPNSQIELAFESLEEEWVLEVIRGVVGAADENGSSVTVSARTGISADSWIDAIARREPLGVILVAPHLSDAHSYKLSSRGIPHVLIDPDGDPAPNIPSVGSTNFAGGMAAARHLIELGHEHVGVIAQNDTRTSTAARVSGFRSAFRAAGIALDESLIDPLDRAETAGSDGSDLIAQALSLLMRAGRPTAVFATSDVQARGVYEAARREGIAIPDDLSVIGYDDLAFARWAGPPLTTVRQPLSEMGREAALLLYRLREDPEDPRRRLDLGTSLIIRESTSALRTG